MKQKLLQVTMLGNKKVTLLWDLSAPQQKHGFIANVSPCKQESERSLSIGTCWSLEALFVVGAACHGALCPPLQAACSKSGAQQSSCARKLRSGLKVGDWRSPSVMFFAWGRESSKNQRWPEGNPKAFKFWNPCSETSITSLNFEQAGQRHSLWKPFHLIRLSHVIKTAFDMVY